MEQTIREFLDCWHRSDLEGALSFMSEDARFEPDLKGEVHVGKDALRSLWGQYMGAIKDYEADVRHIATAGNVVFCERVERLTGAKGGMMTLPIVGVFEFDAAGKIAAWRDYWDTSMVPGEGA